MGSNPATPTQLVSASRYGTPEGLDFCELSENDRFRQYFIFIAKPFCDLDKIFFVLLKSLMNSLI